MEGQNKDSVWKYAEKLVKFIWFVFILLAVAERDGGSLQGKLFETETDDTEARYVRTFGLVY